METELNEISGTIVGAAIEVHRNLGPGLLESGYEECLAFQICEAGLSVERQKPMPLRYRGVLVDCGYRVDLVVDQRVIVEVKAVEKFAPIHMAQMITYLKLSGCALGLLLNFNVPAMRDGIKRVRNGFAPEVGARDAD